MYLKTVFKNNLLRAISNNFHLTGLSTYIVQIPYNISIYIQDDLLLKY